MASIHGKVGTIWIIHGENQQDCQQNTTESIELVMIDYDTLFTDLITSTGTPGMTAGPK